MPDFARRAAIIAQAGIYNLTIHDETVISPLVEHWHLFDLGGLTTEAEQHLEELDRYLKQLRQQARRQDERIQDLIARRAKVPVLAGRP